MTIDENKLNEFLGKVVGDLGATMSSALLVLGDRLGLYKAMAAAGPVTAAELAKRTETAERYVGEWLNARHARTTLAKDGTWLIVVSAARCAARGDYPAPAPFGR